MWRKSNRHMESYRRMSKSDSNADKRQTLRREMDKGRVRAREIQIEGERLRKSQNKTESVTVRRSETIL